MINAIFYVVFLCFILLSEQNKIKEDLIIIVITLNFTLKRDFIIKIFFFNLSYE